MAIQPKHKATITSKGTVYYNPDTFHLHKIDFFYETDNANDVMELIKYFTVPQLPGRKLVVFDTETFNTGLDSHQLPPNIVRRWIGTGKKALPQDLPFCLSVFDGENAITVYDSLANKYAEIKKVIDWLNTQNIEWVAHNIKFDMHILQNVGKTLIGRLHDTVITSKLADNERFSYALVDMAKSAGGIITFELMVDAYKKTKRVTDYRQIPRELLTHYANADVFNCHRVFCETIAVIAEKEMMDIYDNECEATVVFYDMERRGMTIDRDYEDEIKSVLQSETDTAEQAIYNEVGYMFNINSGAQIYQALCHIGQADSVKLNETTGNPMLDKDEMARLDREGVTIAVKILSFRKAEKLLNTYAIGLYEQRDANFKVHCNINQTEATTGRSSINKPALQTLPKRGDKRIRKCFIPKTGMELAFMDLDQVEYRLFAHYAQATDLIEAIKDGHDVHTATAATIFNTSMDQVTDEERAKAKTMNFGLVYGQGVDLTASSLKMTRSEAIDFRNQYFSLIPQAKPFISNVTRLVELRGWIKNHYGRRVTISKKSLAYKGPNYLIQGCAADYAKTKMVRMYKYIKKNSLMIWLLIFVHDELAMEYTPECAEYLPALRTLFSDFDNFLCPITAGVELGDPSWGAKKVPDDIGFVEFTPEELQAIDNYNIYDGGYGQ